MKNIKPSELIKLALHDLEVVESMPDKYVVDMSTWHAPYINKCFVCLAGSVMAISLNTLQHKEVYPTNFPPEQNSLLHALNYFRNGDIINGLFCMEINNIHIHNMEVTQYEVNKEKFKEDMKNMVYNLEYRGL